MTQTQLDATNPHQHVEEVTKLTLALLTCKREDVARACGIFTKEDLISIKLYIKHGLSLPFTQAEVESHIGYKRTHIAGLMPADIWALFKQIRLHSLSWDHIESNIKLQNKHLEITAQSMISTGTEIINIIGHMPVMEKIKTEVGTMPQEKLAEIHYGEDDHAIAGELINFLDAMKVDIADAQARTARIKTDITDFKIQLIGGELSNNTVANGLEPQVKSKDNLMQHNNLKNVLKDLLEEIHEKNGRIEQLKKDYTEYVKKSFIGLAGGVIGLAITGGIFGDKAEKIRKEKNRLIEEVGKLEDRVKNKKELQRTFEGLSRNFRNIGMRMVDAEIAISHLDLMWQSMLAEISESRKQFGNINNALKLTSFVTHFQKVINPWSSVDSSAKYLSDMFDDALKEYQKQYGEPQEIAELIYMPVVAFPASGTSYPEINIKNFKQSIKNIFRLVEFQNQGIDAIKEKATRVKLYARELDERIQSAIPNLLSYLNNMQIQGYCDSITEIDTAHADPNFRKEDEAALLEARVEILMNLNGELARIERLFCENNHALGRKIADLRHVMIAGRVEDSLIGEQKRQKELSADIAQKIQNKLSLKEERTKIVESQDLVRQYNLADLFKDYLPSGSDIDSLDLTLTGKEAIKQGIKQGIAILKKTLGTVSEGLKYSDLAKVRKKLDGQIEHIDGEITALKANLEQVEQFIKNINAVLQIDVEREFVLIEAEKLHQAWQMFTRELTRLQNTDTNALNLNQLLQGQKTFLEDLTKQYSA